MKGYLGCDIGSVSAKMVVIDDNVNILASVYLKNKGLIETVKQCFLKIESQLHNTEIEAVGCTGSGREFTRILVGGDITRTEILAHTVATSYFYPDVKTIFDIGGEDCKIITLEHGEWRNYIMNTICGAGTGAMIESIARSLNLDVQDVGEIALKSKTKLSFPGKCGVLCQSAVVSRKNKGANTADILMGVCRALIDNYLTLAKSVKLEPPYVFQGATARNKALVRALQEKLGSQIVVPEHCELMGAIGIAILAKENRPEKTNFRGFTMKDVDIRSEIFICEDAECSNNCEIIKIVLENNVIACLGSRCGKYSLPADRSKKKQTVVV